MQIDVKSQADTNNVGVLTITKPLSCLRAGQTLKVYSHRVIKGNVILYCTSNPGGCAESATLTNGNFKTGDILVIEEIRR